MGEEQKSAQTAQKTANKSASERQTVDSQIDRYIYTWTMPRKRFQIRRKRITAEQREITLKQELDLVKLLRHHKYKKDKQTKQITSLEDLKEALILPDFLDWLVNSGDIMKIFQILLHPRLSLEEIGAMPLSIQGRVIQDFFGLNPGLGMLLQAFASGKASSPGSPAGRNGSTLPTA